MTPAQPDTFLISSPVSLADSFPLTVPALADPRQWWAAPAVMGLVLLVCLVIVYRTLKET